MAVVKKGSPFPATGEFMQALGIDPQLVMLDGLGEAGYWKLMTDSEGHTLLDSNGDRITVWQEWPIPEIGRLIVQAMKIEGSQ